MRMVSFRLNRECRSISINPAQVLYVCHYEKGAASVHFGKDCFVRVQGDVADVVARIEAGLEGRTIPDPVASAPKCAAEAEPAWQGADYN